MSLFRNALTLLTHPQMQFRWLQWTARRLGYQPAVPYPGGLRVSGFRNFGEFWNGFATIPSRAERAFINKHAGHSGVLIDVGANLGWMSYALAQGRPTCEVYSFEPSPDTYERLKVNLRQNGLERVNAQQIALGKESACLRFLNDPSSPYMNRLMLPNEASSQRQIEVTVTTLDEFLASRGLTEVAFLKVDVEGFEEDVFAGSRQLLQDRRCQSGLVELCPANLARVGSSVERLLSVIHGNGYELHFLAEDGGVGDPVTVRAARETVLTNVALMMR